jgi:curved DNA-binding protein CbpA
MKLDSKYFDSIRLTPKSEPRRPTAARGCQGKGCGSAGDHRAPRGRGRDGEYLYFCLDHVRQFNASYNYFNGMSDAEVEEFQKSATTGHRPTWKLGDGGISGDKDAPQPHNRYARFARSGAADPHDFMADDAKTEGARTSKRRALKPLERKALEAMHLPETSTQADIKARFKELVKRHHPDANGGDRASEDKLREIIQAYNYLKQAGLV